MKADVLECKPVNLKNGNKKFVHTVAVWLPDADGVEAKYPDKVEVWNDDPFPAGPADASLRHFVNNGRLGVSVELEVLVSKKGS